MSGNPRGLKALPWLARIAVHLLIAAGYEAVTCRTSNPFFVSKASEPTIRFREKRGLGALEEINGIADNNRLFRDELHTALAAFFEGSMSASGTSARLRSDREPWPHLSPHWAISRLQSQAFSAATCSSAGERAAVSWKEGFARRQQSK